jgi:hypothetical protein
MSKKITDTYAKQLADLRKTKAEKIRQVEDTEAEMRRIESSMSEADKALITSSSSPARENRKGHKDRATFNTSDTLNLYA